MAKLTKKYLANFSETNVIVKFLPQYDIPYIDNALLNVNDPKLKDYFKGYTVNRLYTRVSEEKIRELIEKAILTDPTFIPVDLTRYFILKEENKKINFKALKNLVDKGIYLENIFLINNSKTASPAAMDGNPDYPNQGYLKGGIEGIGVESAWSVVNSAGEPIGEGQNVKFIDVESGWDLLHTDLPREIPCDGFNVTGEAGHGTKTLGVILAQDNAIGCHGIAPACTPEVVSVRSSETASKNEPDAILCAISKMEYGDVLLIELETGSSSPIETLYDGLVTSTMPCYDVIRLGTALGIVIIEPAGNGSDSLDTFPNMTESTSYPRVLNRHDAAFIDSGAIFVGGCKSTSPTTRSVSGIMPERYNGSNFGSRVDCFAWSEQIKTLTIAGEETTYYAGTSGASAIIAGAAIVVQSIMKNKFGRPLNSVQMRKLLSDPLHGTTALPGTEAIGVMPSLEKIVSSITVNPPKDIYIRDNIYDNGDVHNGAISASPDVIISAAYYSYASTSGAPTPDSMFGERSETRMRNDLGSTIYKDLNNYIYVRVLNRSNTAANNVKARVYFSEVSSLITPAEWQFIGETTLAVVPGGNILTVSEPIIWGPATGPAIPETGHYCFVCVIGNDIDPMPFTETGTLLLGDEWEYFRRLISDNNNITWRNFNVLEISAVYAFSGSPVFLLKGDANEARKFNFHFVHNLPKGTRIQLDFPKNIASCLDTKVKAQSKIMIKNDRATFQVTDRYSLKIFDCKLPKKYKEHCRILLEYEGNDPGLKKYKRKKYQFSVLQFFEHALVGKITWQING